MRLLRKSVAILLIIIMTCGLVPGLWQTSFAAVGTVNVTFDTFVNGKLNIKWDLVPGRGATLITYHTPKVDNTANTLALAAILSTDPNPNKAGVPGLKNDYIYDIKVDVYDTDNLDGSGQPTGTIIATDTMYFLPQISLYSDIVDQQYVDDPAGGRESGIFPALKISWTRPRVYDGTGTFIDLRDINSFGKIDPKLTNFSYVINVTDSTQRSDIKVNFDSASNSYTANVSGDVTRVSKVNYDGTSGRLYFYLLGMKDDVSQLPTMAEVANNSFVADPTQKVLPTQISSIVNEKFYVLPDKDIRPGTVYYLKISSLYYDINNTYLDAVTSGPSGNPLIGLPYTYTPIRFQLTKNSLDNVNVKIYRINKGNLSMPQMYYDLQLNTVPSSDDNSWANSAYKDKEKKLDGTYFTGEFAYTVVSGVGINNSVYYRIVVRTSSTSDRIESIKTPYTISADTSRPPVPKNVTAQATKLSTGTITVLGNPMTVKSSDIVISWDKPANWDQIKMSGAYDPNKDVYFHFLINTSQTVSTTSPYPSLNADGQYFGDYALKYRLVKYVSANSPKIRVNGNRLEYTISAFEIPGGSLFQWENNLGSVGAPAITNSEPNGGNYPSCVLPNTVYYLRMYSTNDANKGTPDTDPNAASKISDMSLTTSFTTLSATQRDVPLPNNIKAKTGVDQNPRANYIQLQFDKVKIDWDNYTLTPDPGDALYYDIYMSNRTDPSSFIMVGTTKYTDSTNSDIVFDKLNDSQSVYFTAKIKNFRNGITYNYNSGIVTAGSNGTGTNYDPFTVFGNSLMPNSTYYFIIKTRLVFANPVSAKESIPTVVIPVTTLRTDIVSGDETTKRHIAPTDFAIAKDAKGNQLVSGQKVTFSWSKKETLPVNYELICSTARVAPDTSVPPLPGDVLATDPIYTSFKAVFGSVGHTDVKFIDPAFIDPPTFDYDPATNLYTLTISNWISPNNLYYFSLRTVKAPMKESVWISIPVTTSLIEGPTMLEPVNDSELGFSWKDETIDNARVEEFKISIKGPKDTAFQVLTRAQAMLVLDPKNNHKTDYYLRIFKLLSNTQYQVLIEKPTYTNGRVTGYLPFNSFTGPLALTKDDDHQIEVKWKGLPVDNLAGYQIAIKKIDDPDYTILDPTIDLELYKDISLLNTYPYFIEKNNLLIGTSYSIYHARIKTVEVTLSDGTKQHQPLKANTKYYIKVRAYKADTNNSNPTAYSKYIGPVDTRTEFNQGDYDQTDQDIKKTALFLDKISKLEENLFWRVGMNSSTVDKVFLKGDRVENEMQSSGGYSSFTLDISSLGLDFNTDVLYVPVNVVQTMNAQSKSLVIKTLGGEFTFKPQTLDLENLDVINSVRTKTGVNDIFLKMSVTRVDYPKASLPTGAKSLSKVNDLEVQVLGSTKKDSELRSTFKDKLYNDKTGLIKQKTDTLLASNQNNSASQTPKQVNDYIDSVVKEVEADMSDYINTTIEGSGSTPGIIIANDYIKTFNAPMLVRFTYSKDTGKKVPYINYDTSTTWQKLTNNITDSDGTLAFSVIGTGKYTVMTLPSPTDSIAKDYWAKDSINKMTSKYDLSDVFVGINTSFNPETSVSVKEIVLLFEKVMNQSNQNAGLDAKQKMKNLGLDSIFNPTSIYKDIQRQELAAILIRVYASKQGIKADSLKPLKSIYINDENDINKKYYNFCVLSVDMELLGLNQSNDFTPLLTQTRAEIVTAFVKVLQLTGDIK